ncbi:hypothetical protein FJ251_03430 [bacterium]|nr:hypothetical protein [bacterium]
MSGGRGAPPRLRPGSLCASAASGAGGESPPLTSLVDMMTILVVFLLVNFSVQGELAGVAADLRLPASSSAERLAPAAAIDLSASEIRFEGRRVTGLVAARSGDSLLIAPLAAALAAAPGGAPARVNIHCDRELDFALLRRVLQTCGQSGVRDYALVVRREAP